ncbi:MAG TPA: sterol desaturase family protein [Novosphingobium sp.]|nr:sterol desaturase family protein [Novosphingobium sp.]
MGDVIGDVLAIVSRIPQVIFTWGTFFVAALLLFLHNYLGKQGLSWRNFIGCCLPFNPLKSKSFHADVKIYVIRKLTDSFFLAPGAATLALVSAQVSGYSYTLQGRIPSAGTSHAGGMAAILLCGMVLFVVTEFSYFLWHFLEHKVPFLWEMHKVHHSADVLNPLTNQRAHSVQMIFRYSLAGAMNGIPAGIFMSTLGFSFAEILVLLAMSNKLATILTLDPLRHSHFPVGFGPLDRIFISPHMHQIHHSKEQVHWDRNFGTNLSVFDWMFGTAYKPAKSEVPTSGIYGYSEDALQQFNTLHGTYIAPLRESFRCIAAMFRPNLRTPAE